MRKIVLSEELKEIVPATKLGIISANVEFEKQNKELWAEIEKESQRIEKYTTETIKDIPAILSSREAYKALGKEPSRYRPSAEALHRRLIQGKGMYQISNLVDTINLASLKTGYSIGGFDESKIFGDITFQKGSAEDEYIAIGRGLLNIDSLPVLYDEVGPFGSPTSDSERTKITQKTKKIFLVVINFGGHANFENDIILIKTLIEKYCNGKEIQSNII